MVVFAEPVVLSLVPQTKFEYVGEVRAGTGLTGRDGLAGKS